MKTPRQDVVARVRISYPLLVQAAKELNEARDDLRATCERIAGVELPWSCKWLMQYADLFIQYAKRKIAERPDEVDEWV